MLGFADGASAHEKSYITIGQIPEDVSPESKRVPFSIISQHALVHTVSPIQLRFRLILELDFF
jgi:ribonuclease P/MRP protein subunit RPP40